MSSPSHRSWKWWLGFGGLLLVMAFPWAWGRVPIEWQLRHFVLLPVASPLSLIGLVYTASFLAILVHEGGHWFFGKLVGIGINRFVVGTGPSPLTFTCRGIEFSFGPAMYSGFVTQIPARENLRIGRRLLYYSGGMLAEVLFLGALYLVPIAMETSATFESLRFLTLVSGGFGIWASARPAMCTIEGQRTPNDALNIVQAWRNRGRAEFLWQQTERRLQANDLARSGRHAEAALIYEQMVAAEPEDRRYRWALAANRAAAGNVDTAMAICHQLIESAAPNTQERADAINGTARFALRIGSREDLARIRPFVREALDAYECNALLATMGAILVELEETMAGVKLLNECVQDTDNDQDRAIANAYLAKAALRLGRPERAAELLGYAKAQSTHKLVVRMIAELDPQLVIARETARSS